MEMCDSLYHPFSALCLSASVCLSLCLVSVSLSLCFSVCLYPCFYLCLFVSIFFTLSISFSLCLYVSQSICIFVSLSHPQMYTNTLNMSSKAQVHGTDSIASFSSVSISFLCSSLIIFLMAFGIVPRRLLSWHQPKYLISFFDADIVSSPFPFCYCKK
jgi:hypothetical protein